VAYERAVVREPKGSLVLVSVWSSDLAIAPARQFERGTTTLPPTWWRAEVLGDSFRGLCSARRNQLNASKGSLF
jgi:hypothetical protein